jgi:peptidyl-prolyl cis-trans isomerase B (cyclophilin B)
MPRLLRLSVLVASLAAGCSSPTTERAAEPVATEVASPPGVRYDQTFEQACSLDPGEDQIAPPAVTVAGKNTALVREAVEREWPKIALTDADGQPRAWTVTLETDLGPIEIALRPALAPNHCRNFIALAKVGYYDGLRFDRIVRQEAESPDGVRSRIELVRFGCPVGTGDPGIGHLGYHLKSEFSDAKHEPATVGFVREADASSAGVRLYITLGPCPALDGNYTVVGTVMRGMDVVNRIAAGKLLSPENDPTRELPERPVVIRRAVASEK